MNPTTTEYPEWQRRLSQAQSEMYRVSWWRWQRQARALEPVQAADLARYALMKATVEHRLLMGLTKDARIELIWMRMGRYLTFVRLAEHLLRRARRYQRRSVLLERFLTGTVASNAMGLDVALEAAEPVVLRFVCGWVFRWMGRVPRWTVRWSRRRLLMHLGRRSAGVDLLDDVRRAMEAIYHQVGPTNSLVEKIS